MKKDQQTPTATPPLPPLTLAEAREIERERRQDSQHAPGPWKVGNKRDGLYCVRAGYMNLGNPMDTYPVANAFTQANALLIAAAPELLEALEAALNRLEHLNSADLRPSHQASVTDGIIEARDAIAKAKGQK